MRYIIIFEDNTPYAAETISSTDIDGSNDGILQIIDCQTMKTHVGPSLDQWKDIEEWQYE